MTCATARERLLACERPDKPGPDLSRHLASCEGCRQWLRRLVRLERQIARRPLDVPPVPAALFEVLDPVVLRLAPAPESRREGGRRKAALASSLAAALLLFAVGWWAWPHLHDGSPSLAAYHARRDAHLAKAGTAPRRVGVLIELAGDLVADARGAAAEQAERVAASLDELFRVDLPAHAAALDATERAALQPLLGRLSQIESDAARSAAECRSPRLAMAYERMAGSCRHADRRLRALLRA